MRSQPTLVQWHRSNAQARTLHVPERYRDIRTRLKHHPKNLKAQEVLDLMRGLGFDIKMHNRLIFQQEGFPKLSMHLPHYCGEAKFGWTRLIEHYLRSIGV